MVGDNPEVDIAGARAAGIPAILVTETDPGSSFCSGGLSDVSIVKDLSGVVNVLD
jgi:FMN phosphatase YigB (HAD superfamily)